MNKDNKVDLWWLRLVIGLILIIVGAYTTCNVLGCSTIVHNEWPSVTECHMAMCPTDDEIYKVLSIVKKDVPDLDLNKELDITWYPTDYVIEHTTEDCPANNNCYLIGVTDSKSAIEVSSIPVLIHEVMHVYYWRALGDPDSNHATPPGPWNQATYDLIDRLSAEVLAEHPELIKYY